MEIFKSNGRYPAINITNYDLAEEERIIDIVKGFTDTSTGTEDEKHFYKHKNGYIGLRGNEKIEVDINPDKIIVYSSNPWLTDVLQAAIQPQNS